MSNSENLENKAVLKNIFKVNQRLEIILTTNNNQDEQYKSRIEEVAQDFLIVAMPISKGAPVTLRKGEIFSGRVFSDSLTYQFTSVFIDRRLSPLPVWIIGWPYNVTKTQQRSFVRIDIALPAFVTLNTDDNKAEPEKINVMTKDISGGGVQLISEKPLTPGSKIRVAVNVPECGMISAVGEVARSHQPQPERPLFWIGVKFLNIQEKDRTNLIKFIFKKQLEIRRRQH